MKRKDAYDILGVNESSSEEEIKKAYKSLMKKYHPDLNRGTPEKEKEAQEKSKQINEAYDLLTKKSPSSMPFDDEVDFNMQDIESFINNFSFSGNFRSVSRQVQDVLITLPLKLSEAVWGTKKEITYKRSVACQKCDGQGFVISNDVCKSCHGTKRFARMSGNIQFVTNCMKCNSTGKEINKCLNCNNGIIIIDQTGVANIPSGVTNENIISIPNKGNFALKHPFYGERYSNLLINIKIEEEPYFEYNGKDLISKLEISLLEALKGTKKKVKTLDGEVEICIAEKTKNLDVVHIENMGVGKKSPQKVYIYVKYPEDISKIVEILEN